MNTEEYYAMWNDLASKSAQFIEETKWVRIMCDYSATGVWDKNGTCVAPGHFPVSSELLRRLTRWQDWYETSWDNDKFDTIKFSAEGYDIAKAFKRELGPDWTVIYLDESKIPEEYSADEDRSVFEYEIKE